MSGSNRRIAGIFLAGASSLIFALGAALPAARGQDQPPPQDSAKPQAETATGPLIKKESRLVLVDAVVTDKKGNYIRDLKQDEFRVYEDDKEQQVSSFSFGSDTGAPESNNAQKRYLVLFFDNSSMALPDQMSARTAATKFIDANASPDHLMAVVEFTGALRIVQNFTASADLLHAAARGIKSSSVASNISSSGPTPGTPTSILNAGSPTMPSLSSSGSDYGARTMLLAIRTLAKNLRAIPGRKMVVLFSSGFPLTAERESELTATIDACNKANVAIYALDVRGLSVPGGSARVVSPARPAIQAARYGRSRAALSARRPRLVLASFPEPQRPGGGEGGRPAGGGGAGSGAGGGAGAGGGGRGGTGGAPGGSPGGAPGGTPGGTRGNPGNPGGNPGGTRGPINGGTNGGRGSNYYNNYNNFNNNPLNQPRNLIPAFPESAATNQQILAALAEGTGGFTIFNSNDLLAGLQRIGREQDEFYLLGYVPAASSEGTCHTLKVKLNHGGGMRVRSRSGYCNAKPQNILEGTPIEKQLEMHAKEPAAGSIRAQFQAPYFYTGADVARVDVAMDIPPESFHLEKEKGKYTGNLNIIGIAYKPDGSIGARFSDQVKLDMEKDEWKKFEKVPYHYSNQFDAAPGSYNLTIVLSTGAETFGKMESPLKIDSYDGKQFSISPAVMTNETQPVSALAGSADLDAALLEDRTPLVSKGVQFMPLAQNHFKQSDKVAVYSEIYEPLLASDSPPQVVVGYKLFDESNKEVFFTGNVGTAEFIQKGNPVIPVGLKVPLNELAPGKYRLVMLAIDGAGRVAPQRTTEFDVSK